MDFLLAPVQYVDVVFRVCLNPRSGLRVGENFSTAKACRSDWRERTARVAFADARLHVPRHHVRGFEWGIHGQRFSKSDEVGHSGKSCLVRALRSRLRGDLDPDDRRRRHATISPTPRVTASSQRTAPHGGRGDRRTTTREFALDPDRERAGEPWNRCTMRPRPDQRRNLWPLSGDVAEEPIARPRLQALPPTRHCIQCARELESRGWE